MLSPLPNIGDTLKRNPAKDFHDTWQGHNVEITAGPFSRRQGIAGGTYEPLVQVALPVSGGIERLWIQSELLHRI